MSLSKKILWELARDYNGGMSIAIDSYQNVMEMGNHMGFSAVDILEAALVQNTTDNIQLITDYLLSPEDEKKLKQHENKKQLLKVNPKHYNFIVSGYLNSIVQKQTDNNSFKIIKTLVLKYYVQTFKYASDFDKNGIIYWLGSNYGSSDWKNPALSHIKLLYSSLCTSSMSLCYITDNCKKSSRCLTDAKQNQWIMIDFVDISILPTHYSLRDSWFETTGYTLRNWILQGCNDSTNGFDGNWYDIIKHKNDQTLDRFRKTHTWVIPCTQTIKSYSQFRIYQNGVNSSNNYHLALSGFEIYGIVTAKNEEFDILKESKDLQQRFIISHDKIGNKLTKQIVYAYINVCIQTVFSKHKTIFYIIPHEIKELILLYADVNKFEYSHDFDKNGFLYYLGTKGFNHEWCNPGASGLVTCKSSSLMADSQTIHAIVGRTVTRCVTKPLKSSWMMIDFKNFAIAPTHYTLRHYASWDTEALRNWRFEASLDKKKWIC
eukprot:432294_1